METNLYDPNGDEFAHDYSLSEMDALLSREEARIRQGTDAYTTAEQHYRQNVDLHPFAQGTNGDQIRAELSAKFMPGLEQAETDAASLAETVHSNARAIWEQTSRSQYTLTDDELRKADSLRNFVREDAEMLPYPQLVDAVRGAIINDDKAAMYCFLRYVPLRLAAGERGADGEWRESAARREKDDLRRMLDSIGKKLKDSRLDPVHQRAGGLMAAASDLRNQATKRTRAQQRYAFQGDHDVSWGDE